MLDTLSTQMKQREILLPSLIDQTLVFLQKVYKFLALDKQ